LKFLTLLLLPVVAQAQMPDARDLLTRASSSIFVAKTVRLEGTLSRNFAGGPSLPASVFKLAFVRGGLGREEWLAGSTTTSLRVFDGANLWEYHSLGNQYTKTPLSTWQNQNENIATLDYGRNPLNIISASIENEEAVEFAGRPVPCYVVRAAYRGAPSNRSNRAGKDVLRRVWIVKDAELVLRDYWDGSLDGVITASQTTTTTYTLVETDMPLPNDLFAFQPPPGSKLGPPVVLGGIIGNVPTTGKVPTSPVPPPPPPARSIAILDKKVDPGYTPNARADGLQGSVLLNIEVAIDGRIEKVRVSHGLGMGLDEKAVAAVQQWQYKPAPAVAGRIRCIVEVPFRLDPPGPWVLDGSVLGVNPRRDIPGPVRTANPELRQFTPPDPSLCSTQGYIGVNFTIESDGAPSAIQITSAFDESVRDGVLQAVKSWRYQPATLNGSKAPGHARILLECRPPAATTPDASSPERPVRVGTDITPPALLFKMEPEYSEEARQAKSQGNLTLSLIIEPDGKPSDIRIVQGLGLGLDEQAIAAVMQWRFKPGTRNGKPVRVATQIVVSFRLL
jgi:TonB family protein